MGRSDLLQRRYSGVLHWSGVRDRRRQYVEAGQQRVRRRGDVLQVLRQQPQQRARLGGAADARAGCGGEQRPVRQGGGVSG